MPAPRFPSMPTLVEEAPAPAPTDFHAEAQRFADAARRAADYADAMGWAASIAAEASLLAAAARPHEGLQKLREAQAIELALSRGEVPARPLPRPGSSPDGTMQVQRRRLYALARQAWTREGATIAVIVTMALLILVLAVSLAVGS
jgi:hypothetical protein